MPEPRYVVILAATKREGYTYAKRAGISARNCRIPLRAGQLSGLRKADFHVLPSFHSASHRHALLAAIRNSRGITVDFKFYDVDMPEPKPVEPTFEGDQMTLEALLEQIEADEARVADARARYAELREQVNQPESPDPLQDDVDQGLDEAAVEEPGDWLERVGDVVALAAGVQAELRLQRQHEVAIRYDRLRDAALAEYVEPPVEDHQNGEVVVGDAAYEEGLDAWQAEIVPEDDDVEPEKPAKRRRSRCPDCGELRFPDDHEDCGAAKPAPTPAPEPVTEDSPVKAADLDFFS